MHRNREELHWLHWELLPPWIQKMFKLSDQFRIFRWQREDTFHSRSCLWALKILGWPVGPEGANLTTSASWSCWFGPPFTHYFLYTPGLFHICDCLCSPERLNTRKQWHSLYFSYFGFIPRFPQVFPRQLVLVIHIWCFILLRAGMQLPHENNGFLPGLPDHPCI